MQKIILSGNAPTTASAYNPTPFASIKTIEDKENTYTTLYNGVFQEVFRQEDKVQYGHFTYNIHTRHIEDINIKAQDHYLIDPVAFAYGFGARMYDGLIPPLYIAFNSSIYLRCYFKIQVEHHCNFCTLSF